MNEDTDFSALFQFDSAAFRNDFPALKKQCVYLDSASTSLKPKAMIKAVTHYYNEYTANANRSLHSTGKKVTHEIETTRQFVADFIHADSRDEIVWTKGSTESLNLIAYSYGQLVLKPGDEIIVSDLEHHSNLIPWLIVAAKTGAKVVKWSMMDEPLGEIITEHTQIVCVTHMSNVTGYCPNLTEISRVVHEHNAVLVVDGAQGIVHKTVDVIRDNIDFYVFSAHKLYGPTGVGVLYGKLNLLDKMLVWHGGGKMLKSASFDGFQAENPPYKFEAGTPNIAGIIGFYAALKWLTNWNTVQMAHYTQQLSLYAITKLSALANIQFYSVEHSPIITFNIAGIHHTDLAILLSEQNVALRAGELCAQPLIKKFGCKGVVRISLMPYNNRHDIDCFLYALDEAIHLLTS